MIIYPYSDYMNHVYIIFYIFTLSIKYICFYLSCATVKISLFSIIIIKTIYNFLLNSLQCWCENYDLCIYNGMILNIRFILLCFTIYIYIYIYMIEYQMTPCSLSNKKKTLSKTLSNAVPYYFFFILLRNLL